MSEKSIADIIAQLDKTKKSRDNYLEGMRKHNEKRKLKKLVIKLTGKENYRYVNLEPDVRKRKAMILALQKDLILFVRKVVGAEPTNQQLEFLRLFQKEGAKLTIKSGHGIGKSCVLSWIILHSLLFIHDVRILCTAPSSDQMDDVLWAELRLWYRNMQNKWWQDQIRITQGRAEFVDGEGGNANRFATARTARKENPTALQGRHTHRGTMIVIVDEAAGVDNSVFEAGSGSMSGKNTKVVLVGNPTSTDPDNHFYKTHHKNKRFWTQLHFSGLDSPLVDSDWVKEVAEEYGEESAYYSVRVLGEFPEVEDDILIPLFYIDSAYGRIIRDNQGERICGVDPARFGDDAFGLIIRQGNEITYAAQWRKHDAMYSAALVADLYKEKRFDIATVDTIGLGGPIADRLRQLIGAKNVLDVNVSERPAAREKFAKLRDEVWWASREFFLSMNAVINPKTIDKSIYETLAAELSTIKYGYTTKGLLKVQSKDELRKIGRKSPNLADALNLTFVRDVCGEQPSMAAQRFDGKARKIAVTHSGAFLG